MERTEVVHQLIALGQREFLSQSDQEHLFQMLNHLSPDEQTVWHTCQELRYEFFDLPNIVLVESGVAFACIGTAMGDRIGLWPNLPPLPEPALPDVIDCYDLDVDRSAFAKWAEQESQRLLYELADGYFGIGRAFATSASVPEQILRMSIPKPVARSETAASRNMRLQTAKDTARLASWCMVETVSNTKVAMVFFDSSARKERVSHALEAARLGYAAIVPHHDGYIRVQRFGDSPI